jgi:hypothetical protein
MNGECFYMTLDDFYKDPAISPIKFFEGFEEENRRDVLNHQKNFKIKYRTFFYPKRFFYLLKCHLTKKIVIGQSSFSGLGDTVLYSHLPRLIKSTWPNYKVIVYETVFSKIVFANNPFIDGFTSDKKSLWKKKGSGSDYGSGHFIQRKARFLGLKSCLPKGDIFLNNEEINKSKNYIYDRPIATFHAHGKSNKFYMTSEIWSAMVKELQKTHYVIQLKSPDEGMVEGVDKVVTGIRECLLHQSVADVHVGVDSGFAHTAAALNVPTVIVLDKIAHGKPFLVDGIHQLVLPEIKGGDLGFLYPQNSYLCVGPSTPKAPCLTKRTLRMAINGEIYPFRKRSIWDMRG